MISTEISLAIFPVEDRGLTYKCLKEDWKGCKVTIGNRDQEVRILIGSGQMSHGA